MSCSCIPVRVSVIDGRKDISILMISSRGGKGLVFPKVCYSESAWTDYFVITQMYDGHAVDSQGGWEADETVEAAAARETVEEAGVRGSLEVSDIPDPGPCHRIYSYTTVCSVPLIESSTVWLSV